ncbi:lipase family protein [Photobacterium sagamiensis]|uniref:lipase family protein n=1 Tax=Photobacterium sagamiensis TaxID=2910241 RepID=UPI003D0C71DB
MINVKQYKSALDRHNALAMAKLSKLVYSDTDTKNKKPHETYILQQLKTNDSGYRNVTGYDRNTAQAMLVEHESFIAVVFRGTDEIGDWVDNLKAFAVSALFGDFHRGFYESLDDIWSEMEKDLNGLKQAIVKDSNGTKHRRPIFFAGHSLGGAMATIAAAKYINEDKQFTAVYTYGQPRAMTRSTARIFNAEAKNRLHRFQNNEDIVTRVPARVMNYSHVGQCCYIDADGQIHTDPGFWFRFMDYIEGAVDSLKKMTNLGAVDDHDIDKYIAAVEKWDYDE